jgi:hypothetical protein
MRTVGNGVMKQQKIEFWGWVAMIVGAAIVLSSIVERCVG